MTENNKVIYDGQTLIDLTQDDVTASDVRNGVYFHNSAGVRGQGTLASTSVPTASTIAEWDNDAHMNSTDMSAQEIQDFVDGNLNGQETITRNDLRSVLDDVLPTRTLLWTNPSPNASFAARDVSLPNVYNNYDFLEVEYKIGASEDTATGEKVMDRVPCKNWTRAMTLVYGSGVWVIIHRARWWTANGLHFDSAYWNTLDSYASSGQDDSNMIPYKIYGIKGE